MSVNYLFVAVVALFVYMIVRGYSRGFLRMVVTFVGLVVILVAVKSVSPYVSSYLINNTNTYSSVQEKITEKFKESNLKYDNTIKENQELTINSYDVPDILKNNLIINNTQEMYQKLLVSVFEEYVSAYLAKTAINAMSFVILFVVLIAVFKIVLAAVDLISRIPIIKGINKYIGGCLGFLEALVIVWIFFFIIVVFIGADSSSQLFSMINESKFLTVLFNTNALMGVIS
ncbi:MAG: CvpA family protein [Lachnospiraceae bacterium]|nr:CvpA family protein [Lachnospiraceae bacterium]